MPLIRLDVPASLPAGSWRTAVDVIYEALRSELGVPENDRFAVVSSREPAGLQVDPAYLGIARSEDAVIVQVTLNAGRDVSLKRAFYAAVAGRPGGPPGNPARGRHHQPGRGRAGQLVLRQRGGAVRAPRSMSARPLRLNAGWRRPFPCR
jgi:4-oxalocrotonate tautomerase